MNKKYIVRLTAKERRELCEVVKKLAGSSQKVRRGQMLLKADVAGPGWTDERIAEAFDSRTRTVEKLRDASGPAAQGLRQLDAAAVGSQGRGIGDCRINQP